MYIVYIQLSMLNLDTISWAINVNQTLACILSTPRAINRSMPNQWARSQLVCFNENRLLSSIKSEFLYQLSIFLHVGLELGINSVITSTPFELEIFVWCTITAYTRIACKACKVLYCRAGRVSCMSLLLHTPWSSLIDCLSDLLYSFFKRHWLVEFYGYQTKDYIYLQIKKRGNKALLSTILKFLALI